MQEAGLGLNKSTFSHHLRIMREAGLVAKRIQGARGYAQLRIHPRKMLPRLATPLKTGEDSGSRESFCASSRLVRKELRAGLM